LAQIFADRVQETSSNTGIGTYTLLGAVSGYQSFAVIGNANTVYYVAANTNNYEIGNGTYISANTALIRSTIIASSNNGSAVNWGGDTKTIFCDLPAMFLGNLVSEGVPTANTIQSFGAIGSTPTWLNNFSFGFNVTPVNLGTVSSNTTLNALQGNYQYMTANGAFQLIAPTTDSAIDLLITNGTAAGTITANGFTVSASIGDAMTTTNTNKFIWSIRRINGVSTYIIKALQ
jgi:hypothetical protein